MEIGLLARAMAAAVAEEGWATPKGAPAIVEGVEGEI
jgi:hypothetical protein